MCVFTMPAGPCMFHVWLVFIICSVIFWKPCGPQYVSNTNTHTRLISKIRNMASELVADAELKVVVIQSYRNQYHKSFAYQVGDLVYRMRTKFQQMIFLYQQTTKNITYSHYDHNQNIATMLDMYRMSMEIMSIAQMIQEYEMKKERKAQFHERMKRVMRTGPEGNHFERDVARMKAAVRRRESAGDVEARPAAKSARLRNKMNKKWRHLVDHQFV